MNKKIVISIFIFLLLVSLIPLSNIVSAVVLDVTTGFEDGVISYPYSNTIMFTTAHSSTIRFNVDNANAYVGTKDFIVSNNGTAQLNQEKYIGRWNYTYSSSQFMHMWEIMIATTNTFGLPTLYMYFNNSVGQTVIKLGYVGTSGIFTYLDYTGAAHTVHAIINTTYKKFGFVMTANDTVHYYMYGTLVIDSPRNVLSDCRISYVDFNTYGVGVKSERIYLDSHRVVITDTISGTGTGAGSCSFSYESEPWVSRGFISLCNSIFSTSDDVIEQLINSKINGTIKGLSVNVGSSQYAIDNDPNNYFVYINGVFIGSADCFTLDNGYYVLKWDLSTISLNLTGEYPLLEFYHATGWNSIPVGQSCSIYGPYPRWESIRHSAGVLKLNGILDGTISDSIWLNTKLYIGITPEPSQYPNSINLYGYKGIDGITHIPYTYNYSSIYCDVTVDNTNSYYNLTIEHNNSIVGTEQFYPRAIMDERGTYGFTPLDTGLYYVNLTHGTTDILSVEFTSLATHTDYAVWFAPEPSYSLNSYEVFCYINDGGTFSNYSIGVFYQQLDATNYVNAFGKSLVGTRINNIWHFTFNHGSLQKSHYWRIFGGSLFMPVGSIFTHDINTGTPSSSNYILASKTNILIDEPIYVNGHHTSGGTWFVYIDDSPIKDVSSDTSFTIPDISWHTGGTHIVSLRTLISGSYIIVDSIAVSVGSSESTTDIVSDYINRIPPVVQIILGLLLTLFITLLPLIIGVLLANHQIDMPNMVYVAFFFLGLGVSCGIGLLNWALFFVILLGLIIYYVVQSQQNKG